MGLVTSHLPRASIGSSVLTLSILSSPPIRSSPPAGDIRLTRGELVSTRIPKERTRGDDDTDDPLSTFSLGDTMPGDRMLCMF